MISSLVNKAKKLGQQTVQKAYQAAGIATETVDQEYEDNLQQFIATNDFLKKFGQQVHSWTTVVKQQAEQSTLVAQLFSEQLNGTQGQNAANRFFGSQGKSAEFHNQLVDTVFRTVLEPIKTELAANKDIKDMIDARKVKVLEFDRYKRKLQSMQESGEDPDRVHRGNDKLGSAQNEMDECSRGLIRALQATNARRRLLIATSLATIMSAQNQLVGRQGQIWKSLQPDLEDANAFQQAMTAAHEESAAAVAAASSDDSGRASQSSSPSPQRQPSNAAQQQQQQQQQQQREREQQEQAAAAAVAAAERQRQQQAELERKQAEERQREEERQRQLAQEEETKRLSRKQSVDMVQWDEPAPPPANRVPSSSNVDLLDPLGMFIPPSPVTSTASAPAAAARAATSSVNSTENDLMSMFDPLSTGPSPPVSAYSTPQRAQPQSAVNSAARQQPVERKGSMNLMDFGDFGGGGGAAAASRSNSNGAFSPGGGGVGGFGGFGSPGGDENMTEEGRMHRANFQARVQATQQAAVAAMREREEAEKKAADERDAALDSYAQRVEAWAGPKNHRKNLRAQLSTFQNVLWPGHTWKPVGLAELVTADQVKRTHKRAVLVVHPDKVSQSSTEIQTLASMVFDVLREALETFRQQEGA